MDTITVSLATMPQRKDAVTETIRSLLIQPIDRLNIYMNAFPDDWTPPIGDDRIVLYRSKDHAGDLADSGKFYMADEVAGFHLTCDDDLLYPPDYVTRMIEAIEDYGRKAVVSFHGGIVEAPVKSYYSERQRVFPCLGQVPRDRFVNIAGTGVMGYHTSAVNVHVEKFQRPYMADIWMGILCQQQRVSQVVRAHKAHWILPYPVDEKTTIYYRFRTIDWDMANAINEQGKWSIHYALRSSAVAS